VPDSIFLTVGGSQVITFPSGRFEIAIDSGTRQLHLAVPGYLSIDRVLEVTGNLELSLHQVRTRPAVLLQTVNASGVGATVYDAQGAGTIAYGSTASSATVIGGPVIGSDAWSAGIGGETVANVAFAYTSPVSGVVWTLRDTDGNSAIFDCSLTRCIER
jgi:hypothetical protein